MEKALSFFGACSKIILAKAQRREVVVSYIIVILSRFLFLRYYILFNEDISNRNFAYFAIFVLGEKNLEIMSVGFLILQNTRETLCSI